MNKNNYGVADIANLSIGSDLEAIDVSTTAYEPGDEFWIRVTGAGNIVGTTVRDTVVTLAVTNFEWVPVLFKKIDTAGNGTTATGLFAGRN